MIVYRIAKSKHRATDLSGTGAFLEGGRWNNAGMHALYTSENRSLAALEILVHTDESELPPNLYIMTIEVDESAPIYEMPDSMLPTDWRIPENIALKAIGDRILTTSEHIGMKVRSAVMPHEYNYVLNPTFPDFPKFVRVVNVEAYVVDKRLGIK
jgi:RES domain-containing protein